MNPELPQGFTHTSLLFSREKSQQRSIPREIWQEHNLLKVVDAELAVRNQELGEAFMKVDGYYLIPHTDQKVGVSKRSTNKESYFDGVEVSHEGFGAARIGNNFVNEQFEDGIGRSQRNANRYFIDLQTGRAWRIDFVDSGDYMAGAWHYYTSIVEKDMIPDEQPLDRADYSLLEGLLNDINSGYLVEDE